MKFVRNKYIYGTAAEKLDYYVENEKLKSKEVIRKVKKNYNKLSGLIVLGVTFTLVMILMQRYAHITEVSYKYNKNSDIYNNIKNENDKLKIDNEKSIDLEKIRIQAENMGLQETDDNHIVYIMVPKKDIAEVSVEYKEKQELTKVGSILGNKTNQ